MRRFEALLSKLYHTQTCCMQDVPSALATRAVAAGFVRWVHYNQQTYLQWQCQHPSLFDKIAYIQHRVMLLRWSVSSTQALMMKCAPQHGTMLLAEHQHQGVGRRQRTWHSPPCCHLYATYTHIHTLPCSQSLGGLSLAVAVIIADLLRLFGAQSVGVKWPNDIIVDGKKIAGILIDSSLGTEQVFHIGIGINCHTPPVAPRDMLNQPWTVLDAHRHIAVDRMLLAVYLYDALATQLPLFFTCGLSVFMDRWRSYDRLRGKLVTLEQEQASITGQYRGINTDGQMLLETENGIIEHYSSAVRCRAQCHTQPSE